MSGKGSRQRPYSVNQKTFDSNWDAIFGKKKKSEEEKFDDEVFKDEFYDMDDFDDPNRIGN